MPKIIYREPHQQIVLDQEPGGTIMEASLANGIVHYHACVILGTQILNRA